MNHEQKKGYAGGTLFAVIFIIFFIVAGKAIEFIKNNLWGNKIMIALTLFAVVTTILSMFYYAHIISLWWMDKKGDKFLKELQQ